MPLKQQTSELKSQDTSQMRSIPFCSVVLGKDTVIYCLLQRIRLILVEKNSGYKITSQQVLP